MFQKKFINYLLISALLFLGSCSSKTEQTIKPKVVISLDRLYSEAQRKFEEGSLQEAIELFEMVEKDYSYTEWAAKSLLMRAYIYYEAGNYISALTILKKFKTRYSGDKNIAYAEYLTAICLFEQINFVALSQEPTTLALRQFEKVIQNYPKSEYASDAKFKIDLIRDQLAAKEMYIGRYYAKRNKWIPALQKFNNVLKKYENTIYIEEALHRLVEINYTIGNIPAAKKYASILGYNYNDTDWYKKSYNIVEGANIPLEKAKQKKSLKERLKKLIQIQ
jgi:outer membrane protein assembly factor BamD